MDLLALYNASFAHARERIDRLSKRLIPVLRRGFSAGSRRRM